MSYPGKRSFAHVALGRGLRSRIGEQMLEDVFQAMRLALQVERLLDTFSACSTVALPKIRILQQAKQRLCKCDWITLADQ